MKRRRNNLLVTLLMLVVSSSFGQLDTFNITVRLDNQLIIEKGKILSNKVKIKSNAIEFNKGVYLLNNNLDSISLMLSFKNYSSRVIIKNGKAENEINLLRSTFKISRFWHFIRYVKFNWICPSYSLNYHNGSWVTNFWVVENKKKVCKSCN
jgi:hypothetical protein